MHYKFMGILIIVFMLSLNVGCEEIVNENGPPGQWEVVWQPDFTVSFADVYAIDSQKVWAVGYGGTVVYTNDGGAKWTRRDIGATGALSQVQFVDAQHGWILEGEVSLYHTRRFLNEQNNYLFYFNGKSSETNGVFI